MIRSRWIWNDYRKKDKPIKKELLKDLPIITLKNIDNLDDEKKLCCVCLKDYIIGDKVLALPCLHNFHPDCVKEWFKEKNVCPICKSELTDEKVYGPEGKKETPGK